MKKPIILITLIVLSIFAIIINSCDIETNEFNIYDLNNVTTYDISLVDENYELESLDVIPYNKLFNTLLSVKNTLNKGDNNDRHEFIISENNLTTNYTLVLKQSIKHNITNDVLISFIQYNDDKSLYYKETKIVQPYTNNYRWVFHGFTLTNSTKFEIKTKIYVKTMDEDTKQILYIEIPMNVCGTFNIVEQTTNYNFIL